MSEKTPITFKPKQVTKRLLSVLSNRAQDVLINRLGLGEETKRMTLESIGKKYKITRERVRQIENYSIASIRKSKEYAKEKPIFDELKGVMVDLGSIVSEDLAGVVDCDYCDSIKVILINHGKDVISIVHGTYIAQLIILQLPPFTLVERKIDRETERGVGGFGSTT